MISYNLKVHYALSAGALPAAGTRHLHPPGRRPSRERTPLPRPVLPRPHAMPRNLAITTTAPPAPIKTIDSDAPHATGIECAD